MGESEESIRQSFKRGPKEKHPALFICPQGHLRCVEIKQRPKPYPSKTCYLKSLPNFNPFLLVTLVRAKVHSWPRLPFREPSRESSRQRPATAGRALHQRTITA